MVAQGDSDVNSVKDIGAGQVGTGSDKVVVTGGSVSLQNGKGTFYPSASSSTPLKCVTVGNLGVNKPVTVSLNTSQGSYGNVGVTSDTSGFIYLWVPPANYVDKLYVNGTRYDVDATSGDVVANPYVDPGSGGGGGGGDEPAYPPPANDNFANATTISGSSGIIAGTTLGATLQKRSEVGGDCYDSDGSVWYRWKAPASGRMRFLVQHPKPASGNKLSVYAWKGTSGTALSYPSNPAEMSHNEEEHGVHGKSVTFDAVKGETYNITVYYGNYPDVNGPFSLSWGDGRWSFYLGKDGKAKIGADVYATLTGAVTIPSTIFGCEVTEIAEEGFSYQSGMTSVTIPSSVTMIGERAFERCTGITKVTIPQGGVSTIGESTFVGCSSLTTVTIPESVVSIGDYAFDGCPLANLTIPSGVKSIGEYAFRGGAFASVTIPATVTSIGEGAFSKCANLKTVNFLGSLPEVDGSSSIYRGVSTGTSSDLVTVVPAGNSSWDAAVAAGTWQQRPIRTDAPIPTTVKVTLNANGGSVSPATLTVDYGAEVGMAVEGTGRLQTPTRPGWDFQGWWTEVSGGTMVMNVKVTSDVTYYAHWKKLYTITFNANGGSPNMTLTVQDGSPMTDFVLSKWQPSRNNYELDGVWTAAEGGEKVTSATIVTSDVIFYAHWKLTTTPTTVTVTFDPNGGELDEAARTRVINQGMGVGKMPTPTREGDWKFEGWWTKRDGGSLAMNNPHPTSDVTYYARWAKTVDGDVAEVVDGIKWYYKFNSEVGQDGKVQIFKAFGEPAAVRASDGGPIKGVVTVPEKLGGVDVTIIGGDAFIGCTEMRKVKLPDTVKEIRSSAFSGCTGLQVASLGNGLTTIWTSAFKDCTSMTGITLPASLQELKDYVFQNCSSLKGVRYLCDRPFVGSQIYVGTPTTMKTLADRNAQWWDTAIPGTWQERPIERQKPTAIGIEAGVYYKETLEDLGFEVPTDGTAYSVTALGLPAGLKLKYNAAVTQKKKVNGKTKTVVVTPAKSSWWIEGVPTTAYSYAEMPPYLVITAFGKTVTVPLEIEVDAQEVKELGEFTVGDSISVEGWLDGVEGSGWTVTGLPAGLKYTAKAIKKPKTPANSVYGKMTKAGLYTVTAKKKKAGFYETLKYRVLVRPKAVDAAVFGPLADREMSAYMEVDWDLRTDVASVGGNVTKVSGLPTGLAFAAKDTYAYKNAKKKTGKYLKQKGQTIKGVPTKAGTYVVTFTKNVKSGKKTVAKTAQILWKVTKSGATPELAFNDNGGEVVECSLGLKYPGTLMSFAANAASVTASGMPKGITLVNTGTGWAFQGYATKAGSYLVTVKATVEGNTVTQRIALKVNGLPAWAKGNFPGYLQADKLIPEARGLGTISVTSAGKVSGKFLDDDWTWTLSAPCFTASDGASFFSVPVTAKHAYKVKEKGKTVTKYDTSYFTLVVTPGEFGGEATLTADNDRCHWLHTDLAFYGQQNLWGSTYKKLGAKLFVSGAKNKNKYKVYKTTMYYNMQHPITVKVTPSGTATVTLKLDTGTVKKGKKVYWTKSCSTTVWPRSVPEDWYFDGLVPWYFSHGTYIPGGVGDLSQISEVLE